MTMTIEQLEEGLRSLKDTTIRSDDRIATLERAGEVFEVDFKPDQSPHFIDLHEDEIQVDTSYSGPFAGTETADGVDIIEGYVYAGQLTSTPAATSFTGTDIFIWCKVEVDTGGTSLVVTLSSNAARPTNGTQQSTWVIGFLSSTDGWIQYQFGDIHAVVTKFHGTNSTKYFITHDVARDLQGIPSVSAAAQTEALFDTRGTHSHNHSEFSAWVAGTA
jgi:hypothetical protein